MEPLRLESAGDASARAYGSENHMPRLILSLMLFLALLVLAGSPAIAADDFYKGKTVKLIISDVPGGGYDAYSRLLARHIQTYLPGQPNLIIQYMPGADGIIAANHMFNVAERDGTVFAMLNRYVPTMSLEGKANVKFKANEFNWLGTATSYADDSYVLIVRSNMPHRTIDDLRNPAMPLHIGSVGTDVPQILKE